MREFQRKKKIQHYLYSWWALAILVALVALSGKAAWNVYVKERDSHANLNRASEQFAALEARQGALSGKIDRLKTSEGVDAEIREQFQVAKPGERMVVVVEDKNKKDASTEGSRSLIQSFFDIFR